MNIDYSLSIENKKKRLFDDQNVRDNEVVKLFLYIIQAFMIFLNKYIFDILVES